MGFLRKALFVSTAGTSGLVVKSNSKKERTAKALEKQVRLQKQQMKANAQIAQKALPGQASTVGGEVQESPVEKLRKLGELRDAGVLTADEFEAKKAELLKLI